MTQSTLRTPSAGTDYPGKTLGIVGLVAAIVLGLIGIVISAVAYSQSKKAGFKNTPALIGMIAGAVMVVIWLIITIATNLMLAGY
ncbi:hypothetical protein [Herbiconiux sp. UC225_62]|uniref:hypothetical protein n=1 Tax=Herbiconiux sp. UC225_62 TaxID=3350168 RepID=UPI0036D2E24E